MSAALIKRFGQEITIIRDIEPTKRVKGKTIPGKTESFVITASVQPLVADETLEGRGGERNRDWIKLYSHDVIKSADEVNKFKGDKLVYQETTYEIIRVQKWTDNRRNLVHYKGEAVKINDL